MAKLTPRGSGKFVSRRLDINVTEADAEWVHSHRGSPWQRPFTDTKTGILYILRGAPCSIPSCFCDAEIVWAGEKLPASLPPVAPWGYR